HRRRGRGGVGGTRRDLAVLQGLDRARPRARDVAPRADRSVRRRPRDGGDDGRSRRGRRARQGAGECRRAADRGRGQGDDVAAAGRGCVVRGRSQTIGSLGRSPARQSKEPENTPQAPPPPKQPPEEESKVGGYLRRWVRGALFENTGLKFL